MVASPVAVEGLDAQDGRELLVAPDPATFASAIGRLADQPGTVARMTEAGRALLTSRHDPRAAAEALVSTYRGVSGGG